MEYFMMFLGAMSGIIIGLILLAIVGRIVMKRKRMKDKRDDPFQDIVDGNMTPEEWQRKWFGDK